MKPLIVIKFPNTAHSIELQEITNFLKTHPASVDYHFLVVKDDRQEGEIQFKYFNETTSL
jgi:hypothetical protein